MRDVRDQVFRIIDNAENGNIGMMEAATELKDIQNELDFLSGQIKDWIDLNIEELSMIADAYKDTGFGGYRFNPYLRDNYSYKHIPEIVDLESKVKELKERSKEAWRAYKNNNTLVDDDGVVVPLPEVKTIQVLTFKKIKYE